jgi:RNA polymerase sigma-70 factor, ECF subfamily
MTANMLALHPASHSLLPWPSAAQGRDYFVSPERPHPMGAEVKMGTSVEDVTATSATGVTATASDDPVNWLLAVAREQDRSAFAKLFAHFAPRIKSYLVRNGTSPQSAEEIAQETMVAVWRKASYYDPSRAAASTWIFTIARNLRIDVARRERGNQDQLPDPSDDISPPEPDALFTTKQHEQRIRNAMAQLSADQATVIRLAFYGDKAHAEVARELGIPLGTVKSRIRLALARLRSLMEKDGAQLT